MAYKTAMQTMIEWGDKMMLENTMKTLSFAEAIDKAEELLELEKEQIIQAFDIGCEDENRIGIEYYNETYQATT